MSCNESVKKKKKKKKKERFVLSVEEEKAGFLLKLMVSTRLSVGSVPSLNQSGYSRQSACPDFGGQVKALNIVPLPGTCGHWKKKIELC